MERKTCWEVDDVEAKLRLKCPECGSQQIIKYGWRITRKGRLQKYQCKNCGHIFYCSGEREVNESE
jgi:predicted RNA-binding Zn-ribbon protein involved in translation (DUF1610 family)